MTARKKTTVSYPSWQKGAIGRGSPLTAQHSISENLHIVYTNEAVEGSSSVKVKPARGGVVVLPNSMIRGTS